MLAIRTTSNSLEIPLLTKEDEMENIDEILNEKYLIYLVNYCNDLFDKNSKRIEILTNNIKNYFNKIHGKDLCNNTIDHNKLKIEKLKNIQIDNPHDININILQRKEIEIKSIMRYGHSIVKLNNNDILIFGGYGKNEINESERRLNDLLIYIRELNEIKNIEVNSELPIPRMFHQSLLYKNKYFISFGGRTNPNECLNDVIIYNIELNKWFIYKDNNNNYPSARWNYSFILTDNNRMILYGGRDSNKVYNDIWELKLNKEEKEELKIEWTCLSDENRKSIIPRFLHCGIDIGKDNILFLGGLSDLIYPMKRIPPIIIYDLKNNVIKVGNNSNILFYGIYGSKILKINDNKYLVVGGMNNNSELNGINMLSINNYNNNEITLNISQLSDMNEFNPSNQPVIV